MNKATQALRVILNQAGLRHSTAARLVRIIDQDDYLGLSADDFAELLQRWKEHEAERLYRWYVDHQERQEWRDPDPVQTVFGFVQ